MTNERIIEDIVRQVGQHFNTFGGGRGSQFNPVAEALKDRPLCFAAGPDVLEVVKFIAARCRALNYTEASTALHDSDKPLGR